MGNISKHLDQAMSKKKKKKKKEQKKEGENTEKKHTQFFGPNWAKFCIWEEFW